MIQNLENGLAIYYNLDLTPRQQQIDAIRFIQKSIRSGNKYMLLNLPTGIGKSYLNIMFINWYLNYININAKFDILTNSKVLQKQYLKDYSYIRNLEGRNNYVCSRYGTDCEEGMELCRAKQKGRCDSCPYLNALSNFISSRISMTNFHMFNIMNIYGAGGSIESRKSNVLIIDEASDYESVFSDFFTTEININSFIKCGFDTSEINNFKNMISGIYTIDDYVNETNYIISTLNKQLLFLQSRISKDDNDSGDIFVTNVETDLKISKQIKECVNKINIISIFLKEYNLNKNNWILEVDHRVDKRTKDETRTLRIQPVWVHQYLPKYIFSKYDHVIFMSATILDKNLFSNINGLKKDITTYHDIPSPFPVENRKIHYIKTGKMTYKEKFNTYERQKEQLEIIFDKYKDSKGIIHTFNYEIADWIKRDFSDSKYKKRLIFHETKDRNDKLEKHINSPLPTILVSPSMMSGIDLKDNLSRFQVIMKIPYPNISSHKIKQRMETYKEWYQWKTVVDLIQSYGRSVRSDVDFADTYLLDSCFSDILISSQKYLPQYIIDAVSIVKKLY